jgi:hypothetical protein
MTTVDKPVTVMMEEPEGPVHVLLDPLGDHIVVKLLMVKGYERDLTLPAGSFAWERAVARAYRGAAFL